MMKMDDRLMQRRTFPAAMLPAAVAREMAAEPLLRGLRVLAAGDWPRARGHRTLGRTLAEEHVLIVCTAGRGFVRRLGREAPVGAGDVLLCPAGEEHGYGSVDADPWTIIWAHLVGDELPHWVARLGFDRHPLRQAGRDPRVEGLMREGLRHLGGGFDVASAVAAAAALRQALALLWQDLLRRARPTVVDEILQLLREDPSRPWTLAELARRAGLSRAQLSRQVSLRTGVGPIDYLIRLRLQRAAELLVTTERRIKEVAVASGYDDPYYFSRLFARVMGCPPRDYRRRQRP